jgi:hypothetical protein
MKKITTTLLAFFLISTCCFLAKAQDVYTEDFGIWGSIGLEKKLSDKVYVRLDEELRTFDNASRIDQFFTNVGVQYRLSKSFRFALVYRFINKTRNDMSYSKRHRLYFDAQYRKKYYNFLFAYRLRTQGQFSNYNSSETGHLMESHLRHKIEIKYQYKKWTPFIAGEFFYQLNDPGFHPADNQFTRHRYYIGTDYDFNKNNTLGTFFLIQKDFNIPEPHRDYVLGFEYTFSF